MKQPLKLRTVLILSLGGVRLFELKRNSSVPEPSGVGPLGSSASSLHAKTFTADRSRVFIGSFNFDPRSAMLNTENGFIIESPAMAQTISDAFTSQIPQRSYEVKLGATGELEWIERRGGEAVVHTEEPGVSKWRTLVVSVLSVLPISHTYICMCVSSASPQMGCSSVKQVCHRALVSGEIL